MGLDITATSSLKKVTDNEKIEDGDYFFDIIRVDESIDRSTDIEVGQYDSNGQNFSFGAGSYSGYNNFRELLCEIFLDVEPKIVWENYESYIGKPFYELINFSDCEGNFGPKVSEKLHKDFLDNKEQFYKMVKKYVKHSMGLDKHYIKLYDNFTKGFEIASKGGVLNFH